ncbi:MAG: anthranilate synthase component I [Planctomycetes bacterium]|nr:anthranilate synthase component I [Planctomycetota bacterium]MBI3847314.1 anthranilate synthase component I [Planctomycetota bacterium]
MIEPGLREMRALARRGNLVPLVRRISADTLTPVLALRKIAARARHAFLFESVVGGEKIARYSFLGCDPFLTFVCRGDNAETVEGRKRERWKTTDPFADLQRLLSRFHPVPAPGLPRFSGGAVGYFAYDAARYVERLPAAPRDVLGLPDFYFMLFDTMLVFDHSTNTVSIIAQARLDEAPPKKAHADASARIAAMLRRLAAPVPDLTFDVAPRGEPTMRFSSNVTRAEFESAVRRAQAYIRAGDVFQVVLSQRLRARTHKDPFNIYRSLRAVNPSPYMFFLRMSDLDLHLIGASPEVMVRVEGDRVTLRPIAGTRPRGKTEEEDRQFEQELLADPKERSEHVMLVDLGRNDVGRVCRYGSVKVDELMSVERYSHVMHITSNVTGTLAPEKTAFDALKSALPAGTVTGAPKVRAMEIIDELEPEKRGPYAGAIGYVDFSGNMDTCIALRTLVLKGRDAYVQAGAGVVADSKPAREWQETIDKAKGLLRALEVAGR